MTALPLIGADGRRRMIAAVTLCALGQAAAAGAAAFATRDVFAVFAAGSAVPVSALGVLITSGCTIAALRMAETVTAERLGQAYAADVRMLLFNHISHLPRAVVRSQRRGGLSLRFVGDLSALRGWISRGLTRLISAAIVLPVTAGAVFALDWRLGCAVAVPIALGMGVILALSRSAGPVHARLRTCRARLSADMSERAPVAPDLRALGRMRREKKRLARRTGDLVKAAVARARTAGALRAVPDAISGLAGAMILLIALRTGLPAATAAGALAATALMIRPLRELAGVWDRHRDWKVAKDKCERLLARERVRRSRPAGKREQPRGPSGTSLKFDQVSHGALSQCSAEIPSGAKVAILGQNSSGKSTLLTLASGIDVPETGRVTLNGKTVAAIGDRARRIALIWEDAPVLAGSLRRALTLGVLPRPSDDAIEHAARETGLGPLLRRLGGLDGAIAEGGRSLSTGEMWRVLMVRARLAGQDVLLFDSPDRALDEEGLAHLVDTIRQTDATVIVTTDSPDLAARFDTVLTLSNGRLAEREA
ncbi:MAG: ABC transporter ATP-binding protein [Pseudomonadota bacterium]